MHQVYCFSLTFLLSVPTIMAILIRRHLMCSCRFPQSVVPLLLSLLGVPLISSGVKAPLKRRPVTTTWTYTYIELKLNIKPVLKDGTSKQLMLYCIGARGQAYSGQSARTHHLTQYFPIYSGIKLYLSDSRHSEYALTCPDVSVAVRSTLAPQLSAWCYHNRMHNESRVQSLHIIFSLCLSRSLFTLRFVASFIP